jgi:8-oxo-dGTP pyrophosphatase MutT (NUDIX family)
MTRTIEKVTAFVTRTTPSGYELLLFEHPNAGTQLPAGTVNQGETPAQAATREVLEETGLRDVRISQYLGSDLVKLREDQRIVIEHTRVHARPDLTSFDWAFIRPGITVTLHRVDSGFTQIEYKEFNQLPDPQYVSMSIKGWVPDKVLSNMCRRHFYHLEFTGKSEDRWQNFADNHTFKLFWTSLAAPPEIIGPQDEWLVYLEKLFNPNQDYKVP